LDDWPTHIHYLNNKGSTGWQGEVKDNEIYNQLRASGEPSPMLRIAERWLRAELEDMRSRKENEKASGHALNESNPLLHPDNRQGGFASGRMAAYDFIGAK
jgi:hypothetical protein